MDNTGKQRILPPPTGYMQELARLCDCGRTTVYLALKKNSKGPKAEMVRKMYRTKYVNGK